jgi:hypothetical protein
MEAHGTASSTPTTAPSRPFTSKPDRGDLLREALIACRKAAPRRDRDLGYDKFPMGVAMNKDLTIRIAQQYLPGVLEHVSLASSTPPTSQPAPSTSKTTHAPTRCSGTRKTGSSPPSSPPDDVSRPDSGWSEVRQAASG